MRNLVLACVAAAAVSFGSLWFAQDAAEEFAAGITEYLCGLSDHRWTNRGEGARKSDARIREPLQGRLAGAYGAEQVVRAKVLAPEPHLQSIQE